MKKIIPVLFVLMLVPHLVFAASWWSSFNSWISIIFGNNDQPTSQVESVPASASNVSIPADVSAHTEIKHAPVKEYDPATAVPTTATPSVTVPVSAPTSMNTSPKVMPNITDVVDQTSQQALNQFVSGHQVAIEGSDLGSIYASYSGKVYIDSKSATFENGSRNQISFKSPDVSTGKHTLYVVGSDGRVSNKFPVYVISAAATSPIPASVTVKINGKENPDPIAYNSLFTVSWTSTNVLTYCTASGHSVPRNDGGLWTDEINLKNSGSEKLYARGADGSYVSPILITISCSTGDLQGVRNAVNIPVNPPNPAVNPLVTQQAFSNHSNFTKTVITEVVDRSSSLPANQFYQGDQVTLKGQNFSGKNATHIMVGDNEMTIIGGGGNQSTPTIIFMPPVTLSPGTYDLYVTNEVGRSNSIQVKVFESVLGQIPINITSIVNSTSVLPTNQFNAGDKITIMGNGFPEIGSVSIDTGGSSIGQMGSGFFREMDMTGQSIVHIEIPFRPSGQYYLRLIGTDGRRSSPLQITLFNANQG